MAKKSRKKAIHSRKLGIAAAASADPSVHSETGNCVRNSAADSVAASKTTAVAVVGASSVPISKSARRNQLKKRVAERKRLEAHAASQAASSNTSEKKKRKRHAASPEGESRSLAVLYEDADVLAINKPDGMLAHPSPGFWDHGTVLHALESRQRLEGFSPIESGMLGERLSSTGEWDSAIPRVVVHRLDRGTTGVMILAKTARAERHLAAQFKQRTTQKRYVALLRGVPLRGVPMAASEGGGVDGSNLDGSEIQSEIRIEEPIAPDPNRRGAVIVGGGRGGAGGGGAKPAVSILHLHAFDAEHRLTLVSVDLLTGRQHQIRAHCAHCGAPLANDDVYGGDAAAAAFRQQFGPLRRGRPLLHAFSLRIPHLQQERIELCAPLPADLSRLIQRFWPQLGLDPAAWPALSVAQLRGMSMSNVG